LGCPGGAPLGGSFGAQPLTAVFDRFRVLRTGFSLRATFATGQFFRIFLLLICHSAALYQNGAGPRPRRRSLLRLWPSFAEIALFSRRIELPWVRFLPRLGRRRRQILAQGDR